MDPIVILGAGLTGLCASIQLRKDGVPHRVLERSARVGGLATTTEEAGYRFDRTGHLLHLRDPETRDWALDLLGPQAWLEIDRKSVVYSHGVVTRYPFQANVYGLPKEVAYRCVLGFVRAHFDQHPGPVVTFEDYCLRHFGEGISDAFMIPYNEKLFGVHPREITASWCDRFVPQPALEDVLGGALGVGGAELGYNARFLYPRLGIGELAAALGERAAPVELGRDVSAIDWRRRTLRAGDEDVPYRSVISSIPLDTLVEKLVDPPDEVRAAGRKLRATSLYYLDLALNTPAEKPWHWVYVPERRFPFYRVGCYSNFSSAMAPPGKASLYVELADRRPPVLSAVLPRIANDLVEIGMIRAPEAIRFARVRHIDRAYVLYDHEREGALQVIGPFLERAGVLSVGRYGAWEYASMEDAIVSGRDAACAAADALDVQLSVTAPKVSFVIPVFNEEAILAPAILDLRENLAPLALSYEVVLAENGSRDGTIAAATRLAAKFPEVRFLSIGEPNYGAALRAGIHQARGEIVVCEEIDLCDVAFHERALALLDRDEADIVVGSKLLPGADDARPATRHAASLLYSALLRLTLDFRGTDTHGLKAMRRERVLPILDACLVDKDVFASELVIRAQRAGLRVLEIPVRVMEKRVPTVNLVRRVPSVLSRVARLWWALR